MIIYLQKYEVKMIIKYMKILDFLDKYNILKVYES